MVHIRPEGRRPEAKAGSRPCPTCPRTVVRGHVPSDYRPRVHGTRVHRHPAGVPVLHRVYAAVGCPEESPPAMGARPGRAPNLTSDSRPRSG